MRSLYDPINLRLNRDYVSQKAVDDVMGDLRLLFTSRLRRTFVVAALCFAVLFSILAIVQYVYVRALFDDEERSRLNVTIHDVVSTAVQDAHWRTQQIRQAADFGPANYIIVTDAGELIDSGGDANADVYDRVAAPTDEISLRGARLKNQLGEPWVIVGQRVRGGRVYLGASATLAPDITASDLSRDFRSFGSSVSSAALVRSKDISFADSVLVLDDFMNVKTIFGGMPVNVTLRVPENIPDGQLTTIETPAGQRAVLAASLTNAEPHARIFAFDDVSSQATVIRSYTGFNVIVAIVAWLVLIVVTVSLLARIELNARRSEISLQNALEKGEGDRIEFKAGFIESEIAQAITAFSNSKQGGNIFIGIDDDGQVVGIAERTTKERDKLLQRIRNIAAQRIRPMGVIVRGAYLQYGDKTVLRIAVSRGAEVFYMFDGAIYLRHMTSTVKADYSQVMSLIKDSRRVVGL